MSLSRCDATNEASVCSSQNLLLLLAKSDVYRTLRFPKIITGFFFFLLVLSTNTLSHSVGQSIYLLICTQQAYFNLFANFISLPWDGLLYVVHGRNSIIPT